MNRKVIYTLAVAILSSLFVNGQKNFIADLKSQGRDSIIKYSIAKLKEKNISNIPGDTQKIRVMSNSKEIYVLFNMGFCWNEQQKEFNNYDLKVNITDKACTIYPADYDPDSKVYKLNAEQKKIIKFVLQSYPCPFKQDERITISEKEYYYEMICSRGFEKGAECYSIDKKTGERNMIWHETPYPVKNINYTDEEDIFIEIK
jgi:hypothetical protein